MINNKSNIAVVIIKYTFVALAVLFVLLPFLWMIITSLMPSSKALLVRPFKLPWPPRFRNYI